jgi:hypothetical protein
MKTLNQTIADPTGNPEDSMDEDDRSQTGNKFRLSTKDMTMRLFVLSTLAVTTFLATTAFHPAPANAVVYCTATGMREGCVARRFVAPAAPVITTTGVGVRRGAAYYRGGSVNRGGPVNRRGRR